MHRLKDRDWRLKHIYKIINKDGQKVLFSPNKIQELVNRSNSKKKIALKSRQIGFSTNEILKQFDFTIFNKNITSVILAHENDAIEKLFRIVTRAYNFMPSDLKPRIDRGGGSKNELYFPEINSRIYCDLESRGDTIQWLHVSEAAFMRDSIKLKSTLQAVPLNGVTTIESTPNGLGNYFYELWNDLEQNYEKFFFPWFMFPDYKIETKEALALSDEERELRKMALKNYKINISDEQILFRRLKKIELKQYSEQIQVPFEQEYPEDDIGCFIASGNSVMDSFLIKEQIDSAKPILSSRNVFKIYATFNKFSRYCIGVDTSEGSGSDYSVAVVIDMKQKEVVATFRAHLKAHEFADKVNELALMYSREEEYPILAVERNNHGHAVLQWLDKTLNYPNLYIDTDNKLGWLTSMVSRPIMMNAFITAIETKYVNINDLTTLNECLTLINNKGKIEAAPSKHDDCIVATAIAIQMLTKYGENDLYDDLNSKILI
jgi:hypothetical protein